MKYRRGVQDKEKERKGSRSKGKRGMNAPPSEAAAGKKEGKESAIRLAGTGSSLPKRLPLLGRLEEDVFVELS